MTPLVAIITRKKSPGDAVSQVGADKCATSSGRLSEWAGACPTCARHVPDILPDKKM
jgi:hypothetical protein